MKGCTYMMNQRFKVFWEDINYNRIGLNLVIQINICHALQEIIHYGPMATKHQYLNIFLSVTHDGPRTKDVILC